VFLGRGVAGENLPRGHAYSWDFLKQGPFRNHPRAGGGIWVK